jgi:hypothetical protein
VGNAAERGRIDVGEAVELAFDSGERAADARAIDQAEAEHRVHVLEILAVTTVDLGEGLPHELEVVHGKLPLLHLEAAAILPSVSHRDEGVRRRELDDREAVLAEARPQAPRRARGRPSPS